MNTPGFDILWIWVSEPPSTGILRSGKGTLDWHWGSEINQGKG